MLHLWLISNDWLFCSQDFEIQMICLTRKGGMVEEEASHLEGSHLPPSHQGQSPVLVAELEDKEMTHNLNHRQTCNNIVEITLVFPYVVLFIPTVELVFDASFVSCKIIGKCKKNQKYN